MDNRKGLWEQGLNDCEIARLLGITNKAIQNWRTRNRLPPNKKCRVKSGPKNSLSGGIHYAKVVPAEKQPVIRRFLADLTYCAKRSEGRTPDVGAFMMEWMRTSGKRTMSAS